MIIKEIKYNKGILFNKEKLVIISDQGKSTLEIKIDVNKFKELANKLNNFSINNVNDFENVCAIIKKIVPEFSKELELAVINSSEHGWKIFNKNLKQIPRPMCLVFKKNKGIKEFYVISLNTKDFDGVVNAGKEITSLIEKSLVNRDKASLDDEEMLLIVKEAADEIFKDLDFELRLGVGFDNYSNGKYEYTNKSINEKEQYEFITRLIGAYGLVYIENPFFEGDLESYKKLNDEFKHKCLICLNSKINEYTKGLNMEAFNAAVLSYSNFKQFQIEANTLLEDKINLVVVPNLELMNLIVALKIPIVKFTEGKNDNEIARHLFDIVREMKLSSENK